MFATTNDQEIYSTASTMYPFYHNQYSQLQQHDAKSIVLQQPTTLYSSSPAESANEMHSRMRGQWMKRVAEWIAQTQGSNPKVSSTSSSFAPANNQHSSIRYPKLQKNQVTHVRRSSTLLHHQVLRHRRTAMPARPLPLHPQHHLIPGVRPRASGGLVTVEHVP